MDQTKRLMGTSIMDLHRGQALLSAAKEYPTLHDALLEVVQNAIDEQATKIDIMVSYKTGEIIVRDNGNGASFEHFNRALQSVRFSIKTKDKYGRYGIGLIAMLGKCEYFTFISCPKDGPDRNFMEWTFRTTEITGQAREVPVNYLQRTDLVFDPVSARKNREVRRGNTFLIPVDWRTELAVHNFTTDRHISRLQLAELSNAIVERYRSKMYENRVVVSIRIIHEDGKEDYKKEIRAQQYQGEKLDPVTFIDEDAGKVEFKLFLAKRTAKGFSGTVSVGETDDSFRFPFKDLVINSGTVRQMPKEVLEAVKSGVFEGEITAENIKLNPSRKSFAFDSALVGFCVQIENWYTEIGQAYYRAAKEEKRDKRYQDLGLRSIRTIELLLQNPQFKPLRDVIAGFQLGTVGRGHAEPSEDKLDKAKDSQGLSSSGQHGKKGDVGTGSKDKPEKDRPKHVPYTVSGPDGRPRRVVRGDSLGIQFVYLPLAETEPLFELDLTTGTMTFNTNHSSWKACEKNDPTLMQLQEYLTIQALALHAVPEEWRDEASVGMDELLPAMVFLLNHSESYSQSGKK